MTHLSPRAIEAGADQSSKNRARGMVRDAIKRGSITRPDRCEKCGDVPRPSSDGRASIHAHHHRGYDHPLDVEWLCSKCHRNEDYNVRAKGSSINTAVLSEEIVIQIKREITGSTRALGRKYGVNATTIGRIRSGKYWSHVRIQAAQGGDDAGQ